MVGGGETAMGVLWGTLAQHVTTARQFGERHRPTTMLAAVVRMVQVHSTWRKHFLLRSTDCCRVSVWGVSSSLAHSSPPPS
jgi:hypothetical protein